MVTDIIELIKSGRNIFITGGGGVGKSYTLDKLKETFPDMVVTSTTGISALRVGGQTIHSWAGIGICEKSESQQAKLILKNKERTEQIQNTTLLAIDEISMLDAKTFKYLDDVLSIVRKNPKPFGGIQVILIGDFFQLPPVGLEMGKKFCFQSPLWKKLNLEVIHLQKVYRQADVKLVEALNNIRQGNITEEQAEMFNERNDIEPPKDAIRIYPTKVEAENYNKRRYSELSTEEKIYWAKDTFYKKEERLNPRFDKLSSTEQEKYLAFDEACNMTYYIKLKVGARVMLLMNTDIEKGLVNGACGYIKDLQDDKIIVNFDNGNSSEIKRTKVYQYRFGKPLFARYQFPLKLAYSSTIHKMQGMTLNQAYINLCNTFTTGQVYVALSRITSLDGLFLKGFNKDRIRANSDVVEFYKNVEQQKVLTSIS